MLILAYADAEGIANNTSPTITHKIKVFFIILHSSHLNKPCPYQPIYTFFSSQSEENEKKSCNNCNNFDYSNSNYNLSSISFIYRQASQRTFSDTKTPKPESNSRPNSRNANIAKSAIPRSIYRRRLIS